jgi:glutamate-1-semialdehyde 2,1-aminomutase
MSTELSDGIASTLALRAARVIPGGVDSDLRLDAPNMFFARGNGAWLREVDGNDVVDYQLGKGP